VILSTPQKRQGMALFSFRHSVKTFSPKCVSANRAAKAGQTAAHLQYITRPVAAREVVRERLAHSSDTEEANKAEQVAAQRKGRVCERFIIALPVEATDDQRLALARRFSEELTKGIAGYIFAIHDKSNKDKRNPHFHLVAFDTHQASGGRGRPRSVIGFARKNAVENTAKRWAEIHNEMMSAWGYGQHSIISNLSFADRGIQRIAEIHEGPASRMMQQRGAKMIWKPEWSWIDAGRTRSEANDLIREINEVNRETKNAKAHRLGRANRSNPCEGDRSGPPFGKNGGRGVPYALTAGRANQSAPGNRSQPEVDRTPPWIRRGHSAEPSNSSGRHPYPPQSKPFHNPKMEACSPCNRHPRIRRIFLELIFLRDSLRSQLATLNGRRSPLSSSKIANEADKAFTQREHNTRER
jgi:hypothetical protein